MSELKSVNIASWGFVILALFLLIIGLEEVFWADGLGDYQFVPGTTTLILGMIMSLIALFAFWNGDRKHGVVFIALGVVFSFIALVIGLDIKLLDLIGESRVPTQFYLGGRGLMFGLAVALFAFAVAAWSYFQEGFSKIVTIMLAAIGVFALIEGISNAMIDVRVIAEGFPPEFIYTFEDAFTPLRIVAGVVAIVAAVLAFYEGYVCPVILGKNVVADEDKSLESFDVTGIGFAIVTFTLLLLGLSGLSFISGLEKYAFVPGISIIFLGTILLVIALFAYWNGNKQSGVVFTWLSLFFIITGFVMGCNIALLDQYAYMIDIGIPGTFPEWAILIGFAKKTLILSIVLGIFTFIFAAWAYMQKNNGKVLSAFFLILGVIAILIGISGLYLDFSFEDSPFMASSGDPSLPLYNVYKDEFVTFRIITGVLAIIAMIISFYGGVLKPEMMTKCDGNITGLKTYDYSAIGFFLMAFCLVMMGIGGITQLESLADYELSPKAFGFMGMILTLIAIPLSYWHGKSFPTALFLILHVFFVLFTVTSMGDRYGIVYGIVLMLFMIAVAFWTFKQKDCPMLFTAIFGLLAVSMLVLTIADFVYDGDLYYTLVAVTGGIQLIAGLVFAYLAIAKTETVKLPTA